MRTPVFRQMPTETDVKNWVDELITPELAEAEGKRLAQLLLAVADADGNEHQYHLAKTAARHAFTKTTSFDEAFNEWAGLPTQKQYSQNPNILNLENEQ